MTDHIGIHQKLVENAVSHLTWHEQAISKTGFKAISQVWLEPPAWLFWLNWQEGAYMLRITEAEEITGSSYCSYLLHYFPQNHKYLTPDETELVNSHRFDSGTCTPVYEHNADFHEHFITAEIGISAPDCNTMSLAAVSLNGRFEKETESFLDFFFGAMNFYTKSHHLSCLKDRDKDIILLPYTMDGMLRFFADYQLNSLDFTEIRRFKPEWCAMAHYSASCSVHGTCGCSH